MVLLKFRSPENILDDFTHYAEVDENKIKRFVGPIAQIHQVSFRISTPIHADLQPYFNNRTEDVWELKIPYDFHFVEGNYLVINEKGQQFILHHNITHFRVGNNNQFVPINNMTFYLWCYFDYETQSFITIGGLNTQFATTTREEIEQNNLERIEL